jgi:hypothetical protein
MVQHRQFSSKCDGELARLGIVRRAPVPLDTVVCATGRCNHYFLCFMEYARFCIYMRYQAYSSMKAVIWMGSSREDVKAFPADARREAGYQLEHVQRGEESKDWRPMKAVDRAYVRFVSMKLPALSA